MADVNDDILLLNDDESDTGEVDQSEKLLSDDKFDKIKGKTRAQRTDTVLKYNATGEKSLVSNRGGKSNPKCVKRKSSAKGSTVKAKTPRFSSEEIEDLKDQMGISLMSQNIAGLTTLLQSVVTTFGTDNQSNVVCAPMQRGTIQPSEPPVKPGPTCTATLSKETCPSNEISESGSVLSRPACQGSVVNQSRPILPLTPNFDDISYDENENFGLSPQVETSSVNCTFDPVQGFSDAFNVTSNSNSVDQQSKEGQEVGKEENDEWNIPQLKSDEKTGPNISVGLAAAVDAALIKRSKKESIKAISDKYVRPDNCKYLSVPMVNKEIWSALCKTAQENDVKLQEIQKNFVSGIIPLVQLADMCKSKEAFDTSRAKALLSDAFSMLGHSFLSLSQRRRACLRPYMNERYRPICNADVEFDSQLFGADGMKKLKELGDPLKVPIGNPRFRKNGSSGNYGYRSGSYGNSGSGSYGSQNGDTYDLNSRGPVYRQGNRGRGRGQNRGYQRQTGGRRYYRK